MEEGEKTPQNPSSVRNTTLFPRTALFQLLSPLCHKQTPGVSSGQSSIAALGNRYIILEATQVSQTTDVCTQQFYLEDLEDWSRRNNLPLQGLPEVTGPQHLQDRPGDL